MQSKPQYLMMRWAPMKNDLHHSKGSPSRQPPNDSIFMPSYVVFNALMNDFQMVWVSKRGNRSINKST